MNKLSLIICVMALSAFSFGAVQNRGTNVWAITANNDVLNPSANNSIGVSARIYGIKATGTATGKNFSLETASGAVWRQSSTVTGTMATDRVSIPLDRPMTFKTDDTSGSIILYLGNF